MIAWGAVYSLFMVPIENFLPQIKLTLALGAKPKREILAGQAGWHLEDCGGTDMEFDSVLQCSGDSAPLFFVWVPSLEGYLPAFLQPSLFPGATDGPSPFADRHSHGEDQHWRNGEVSGRFGLPYFVSFVKCQLLHLDNEGNIPTHTQKSILHKPYKVLVESLDRSHPMPVF